LPTQLRHNFAADTVWMLQLALRGELRRIPERLYLKRYHHESVHAAWAKWSREELNVLWAEQAAVCARIALEHITAPHERELIVAAALMRLTNLGGTGFATPKGPLEVAAATAIFYATLGEVSLPGDVQKILTGPNVERLRRAISPQASPDPRPSFPRRCARRLRHIWRGGS
jgi:hypothetical protein